MLRKLLFSICLIGATSPVAAQTSDGGFGEGDITEVFDDHRIGSTFLEGARVVHRAADHLIHVAGPPGRAGQGCEMNDPDQQAAALGDERFLRHGSLNRTSWTEVQAMRSA